MVEVVSNNQPKLFLAENVKGLVTWENGLAIHTIKSDFDKVGYDVDYRILNAADYGVGQTRERVIIIGIRKDLGKRFLWPEPTHSLNALNGKLPWVTLKEAIGDLEEDKKHFSLANSNYSKAKLCPGTQGNITLKANKPSPTMRAEHHGNIEFHYLYPRRLSAREAARIQSFPDTFVFQRSTTDAYRQIGNAVAPVFAWHLANAVYKTLV
jgi:DNA (cytosine-5)-methyltransferase 1